MKKYNITPVELTSSRNKLWQISSTLKSWVCGRAMTLSNEILGEL